MRQVFKGRTRIYSNASQVTEDNVLQVLEECYLTHVFNQGQIQYLWDYYKGIQPILYREKDIRPEINNKIVENHAQEIVSFKIGYQLFEPIQYVSRVGDSKESGNDTSEQIKELNSLMFAEDKSSCDRDLFEWLCICGLGYRMILPDSSGDVELGGAPFEIYTLDPRQTFVVYSNEYHHKPIMAVWIGKSTDQDTLVFNVYTPQKYFKVKGKQIVETASHILGGIPIIEYDLNNSLMGVFEPVLPLLDAINTVESNRLDGIEQTVQSLMKFINCDISEEDFKALMQLGAIKVYSKDGVQGDVEILRNDLDQSQTQITKQDLYTAIINICGMPSRAAGAVSSDTGKAVLLRDGWTLAESHAKSYELQFKKAERDFLRIALCICNLTPNTAIDLRIRDIELAFNRRNYENILTKAQVLTTMLSESNIDPQLAFQSCGLFTDPEAAWIQSMAYKQEQIRQAQLLTQSQEESTFEESQEKDMQSVRLPRKQEG